MPSSGADSVEWCAQRSERLDAQNDELMRKLNARKRALSEILQKSKTLRADIRKMTAGDSAIGDSARIVLNRSFTGNTKDWKQGRNSFMGISHVIRDSLPKPLESKEHKMIPGVFLRKIEEEHRIVGQMNAVLQKKSERLRGVEAELERIQEDRRLELKKIVDILGKDVVENVCHIRIGSDGDYYYPAESEGTFKRDRERRGRNRQPESSRSDTTKPKPLHGPWR
eukprot:g1116.t1